MIMLSLEPVCLAELVGNIFAIPPRKAVDDSGMASVLLLDPNCHILHDCLPRLRADQVVEVATIE